MMETFTLTALDGRGEPITAEYEAVSFPEIGERLQYGGTSGFWTVTEVDVASRTVIAGRVEYR